jgi:hypothetical protein
MSLPTLPEGWDRDRVYSTNEVDRMTLPVQDQELISAWFHADLAQSEARFRATVAVRNNVINASRTSSGLLTFEEAQRTIALEMDPTNYDFGSQRDLFDVANVLYTMGAEAWGFVVFKTWGYKKGERERWDLFWSRWEGIMKQRLRDMGATDDLQDGAIRDVQDDVTGKLLWWLVDHENMDGKGFHEVRECFAELVDEAEEHIPLGLDLDLALVIDKEAVDSLLNRDESLGALRLPDDQDIFVWGVDVNYDDDDADDGSGEAMESTVGGYPGYFKVSTMVLIPELWHTLNAQSPDELYPGQGHVYGGIVGNTGG